jgi:hypothetical protein
MSREIIKYKCGCQYSNVPVILSKYGCTLGKGYPLRIYQGSDGIYACSALCPDCYKASKAAAILANAELHAG